MVANSPQMPLGIDVGEITSTAAPQPPDDQTDHRNVDLYQSDLLYRIEQLESQAARVELDEQPSLNPARNENTTWYNIRTSEGVVGTCSVVTDDQRGRRFIRSIMIDGYNRKGGAGMATYLQVIKKAVKEGYNFETEDSQQKMGAKRIWERLADAGIARIVHPFIPDGGGYFAGKYIVKAKP
jgi:hypothetical protein